MHAAVIQHGGLDDLHHDGLGSVRLTATHTSAHPLFVATGLLSSTAPSPIQRLMRSS